MKRQPILLTDLKNTACAKLNPHLFSEEKKKGKEGKGKKEKRLGPEKTFIEHKIESFAREHRVIFQRERVFHNGRKWRFDYCLVDNIETPCKVKVAFEYEGVVSAKSRHTTITGYSGDTDKYNVATLDGWMIHRYTALNYLDISLDLILLAEKLKKF